MAAERSCTLLVRSRRIRAESAASKVLTRVSLFTADLTIATALGESDASS
ncbi:MAG TPA: hypothetical protein VHL09_00665 [Dehalococcoidia bacterium]|nr:hypothetical protein [Dehalococcoidia bacterium]